MGSPPSANTSKLTSHLTRSIVVSSVSKWSLLGNLDYSCVHVSTASSLTPKPGTEYQAIWPNRTCSIQHPLIVRPHGVIRVCSSKGRLPDSLKVPAQSLMRSETRCVCIVDAGTTFDFRWPMDSNHAFVGFARSIRLELLNHGLRSSSCAYNVCNPQRRLKLDTFRVALTPQGIQRNCGFIMLFSFTNADLIC